MIYCVLYRGDDENGRLIYEGEWKNKAAHGVGLMIYCVGGMMRMQEQSCPWCRVNNILCRGDDENGRLIYEGEWKNKAAHGVGLMRWQNGDR